MIKYGEAEKEVKFWLKKRRSRKSKKVLWAEL